MLSEFLDLLFNLFFVGRPPRAEKLQEIPLDEMIDKSKLVVVGKVVRIAEIYSLA